MGCSRSRSLCWSWTCRRFRARPTSFTAWLTAGRYAAYLVSFATIALIWIEHHGMMSAVRLINRRFLERTLLFLLFVSIIPWPTALAAEHIRQSGAPARTVALLYAATMMFMGLSMALCWRYLSEHKQLVAEPARAAMSAGTRRALRGALAYIPAIIFALLVPAISLAIDAGIAIYFALTKTDVPGLIHKSALTDESAGVAGSYESRQ